MRTSFALLADSGHVFTRFPNCAQRAAIFRGDRRSQFSGEICKTQHGSKNSKHPAPRFLFAPSSFALDSHTAGAVLHLEPTGRAAELEPKGGARSPVSED